MLFTNLAVRPRFPLMLFTNLAVRPRFPQMLLTNLAVRPRFPRMLLTNLAVRPPLPSPPTSTRRTAATVIPAETPSRRRPRGEGWGGERESPERE